MLFGYSRFKFEGFILHNASFSLLNRRLQHRNSSLRHSDASITAATEGLNGEDLEVEVAVAEPVLGPVVEVVGGRDGARVALVVADGEELGEGRSASNRGLVVASVGADFVL